MRGRSSIVAVLLCAACVDTPYQEQANSEDGAEQVIPLSTEFTTAGVNVQDTAEPATTFFIQDSTQYSATFLAAFRKKNAWIGRHIELRGDSMVVEGDAIQDAIILPTDLPLGKKVLYAREQQDRRYRLELTRRNISTVAYHYVVKDGSTTLLDVEGTADLNPLFYYGAEGDFEANGRTYGMNKYHPNDTKCEDYLLIGQGSIARASYIRGCGSSKDPVLSMGMAKQ